MNDDPRHGLNPVSKKLATARYIGNLPFTVTPIIVFVVLGLLLSAWFYLGALAFLALTCWLIWLIPAQVARLGWLETEDELLLTKGRMWHTFTVVPYGRIQYVDVTAGPVERWLGMKSISVKTASATTDSTLGGLPAAEADALRDRLAERARERMSGL